VNRTQTDPSATRLVGIDLGTTNSALAWTRPRGPIRIFDVPQLASPAEIARFPTLPSFLYFPSDAEQQAGVARLPWEDTPEVVAGIFARDQGALVPARQIASAKSWLANPSVDRTAVLLPWGTEEGSRLSPVQASARLLSHLRDAWNHEVTKASGTLDQRLEQLPIVLTVPASFDEEARELTVQAARDAGLERLVLLEEPIAALYAWIAAHRLQAASGLANDALVLVCDVGGGTTDFSLMRATTVGAELRFERIAIGEHLLLGGDNLDLALAALVEERVTRGGAPKLSLTQRLILRRKCSGAKEQLLSGATDDRVRITILGTGRGVVSGGMHADLTREETVRTLLDGFLPLTSRDELPAHDRRVGLRELGLPYETEPAITKHLAAFLHRAARGTAVEMARPAAVLFNGGFFTPAVARERVLDALEAWSGTRPLVLENERPEAAVAVGAAFYARLRENPDAARRLLIRAGSARGYYIGLQAADGSAAGTAVCIMPRGTQEGTSLTLERPVSVTTNQPVAFTLYSATDRHDALNDLVDLTDENDAAPAARAVETTTRVFEPAARAHGGGAPCAVSNVHRHSPLVTVMRYGKRSRRVSLAVTLRIVFTETGTLELWCESRSTDHRWRLAFNLRAAEADPLDVTGEPEGDDGARTSDEALVSAEGIGHAIRSIRGVFVPDSDAGTQEGVTPETLVSEIETALGFGKHAWPLAVIRQLADALLEVGAGRRLGAEYEGRWLNLTGFCVRPGFGVATDAWRISELRKVYASGLAFPKDIQCQVEWLVLWQRVGSGFSAGHQRELAQRVGGQLGVGQKKPARLNPQIEREAWRLLASLERLDVGQRVKLGDELMERLRRDSRNRSLLWAIGRFGARVPFYGPLNSTVPPSAAERWMDRLLGMPLAPDSASAIVQIGARTSDPARDIADEIRARAIEALAAADISLEIVRPLLEVVPTNPLDFAQALGESLPEGLRLDV
jgi:molecular chaperone DnaK (HSP70)